MTRSTPAVAVAGLMAAGLVLGACGGGSHVIGAGVRATTTSAPTTSTTSGRAPTTTTAPASRPVATTTSAPAPRPAAATPVTPALTAQITSELSQLDQSLGQAGSDLAGSGTGDTVGGK
jgi:hypothetical protein